MIKYYKKRKFYDTSRTQNLHILKSYGDGYYKLTLFKSLKNQVEVEKKYSLKNTVNDEKLLNNLVRSSGTIFELAYCNDWDFFFTGTIDSEKYDREDFQKYYKDFSKFLNNYNSNYKQNVKYLLIPELHKDGKSWHIHGLIRGLNINDLYINKFGYLSWMKYEIKFGYCSFAQVYNKEGVSKYVTKYITKDILNSKQELGNHVYFCSKGLQRAQSIFKGAIVGDCDIEYDYTTDYLSQKVFRSDNDLQNYLKGFKFYEKE